MRVWLCSLVITVLAFVSACSDTPRGVDGTIASKEFDPSLNWVPVQFAPKLVERESLTPENTWPQDGESVTILCEITNGEPVLDPKSGTLITSWYRIFVPTDKMDQAQSVLDKAERTTNGYAGYVEKFWVKTAEMVPACT